MISVHIIRIIQNVIETEIRVQTSRHVFFFSLKLKWSSQRDSFLLHVIKIGWDDEDEDELIWHWSWPRSDRRQHQDTCDVERVFLTWHRTALARILTTDDSTHVFKDWMTRTVIVRNKQWTSKSQRWDPSCRTWSRPQKWTRPIACYCSETVVFLFLVPTSSRTVFES